MVPILFSQYLEYKEENVRRTIVAEDSNFLHLK